MVPKEIEGDKKNPMKPNGIAGDEEEFMLAVAEAGGDDYEDADDEWIVYTAPNDLMGVKKALGSRAAERAESWRPWRAYAVMHLWTRPQNLLEGESP